MDAPRFKDSDFAAIRKANGYYKRNEIQRYKKFSRFGFLDVFNPALNLREYLFFTKPDLHLYNSIAGTEINYQIKNNPFFIHTFKYYPDVYKSLQITARPLDTPFINLLSNQVNSNLELPAIVSETVEGPTTAYGTQIKYQMATLESDQNFDFSLEFKDTESLEVYLLFKLWNEYERNKDKISPPNINYTLQKILHDQVCIYKFIVGDDATSLLYYAKLYGVFPKGAPRDSFGNINTSGGLSYTVNFNATFVDDMNPLIISDFNELVQPFLSGRSDIPIYDSAHNCINGEWANVPYFEFATDRGLGKLPCYKMKWR